MSVTKGQLVGELNGRAKLTEADIREIRSLDWKPEAIAAHMGMRVSRENIRHIKTRKSWKHVID
jgi:hypothetical protein